MKDRAIMEIDENVEMTVLVKSNRSLKCKL